MLKEFLKERNITLYKLSKLSNVPYSTINELVNGKKNINDCKIKTVVSISNALNLSIEAFIEIFNGKRLELSNSWEENKYKIFYFPIIINNDNYECNRIHPLKQKEVNQIYEYVKNNNDIKKVIIFGSSVNIRCNIKSDLDVAILLKEDSFNRNNENIISERIQEITDYNSDIIWLNKLDKNSQLYDNIIKYGVIIYSE